MSNNTVPPAQQPKLAKGRRLFRGTKRPVGSGGHHMRTIFALMLREMSSRYGRTPGGYIWAILEPLGMITMLSFGFSLMLRSPSLGNSFLLFYATGYLPFSLFLRGSASVMNSLNFSRPLLKYPAVSWFDAVFARAILNILTDLLVAYVVMAGILLFIDVDVTLNFVPILLSFGLASLLAIGIGMVNCIAAGFYPLWGTVWNILTRPLFLASGIIWLYEDLPQAAQKFLWWNPLVHITSIARTGYFPTYQPQFVAPIFPITLGLLLTVFGLLLLRRYHLWILNRV